MWMTTISLCSRPAGPNTGVVLLKPCSRPNVSNTILIFAIIFYLPASCFDIYTCGSYAADSVWPFFCCCSPQVGR